MTLSRLRPPAAGAALVLAALSFAPPSAAQNTPARPRAISVRGVRLSLDEGAPLATLVLRDGVIEAILDGAAEPPADTWQIDGEGWLALPGFVDAWTEAGCVTAGPLVDRDRPASTEANVLTDMRVANRKGIQPAFRAADVLALDGDALRAHRQAGFGAAVSAPGGELLAGRSALVVLRDAAARDLVVLDDVFQHAAFTARGDGYPSTLMGYHAQLRQFFLDARRDAELRARSAAGRPGPRPAYDPDFEAAQGLLDGTELLVCRADAVVDIQRWLHLADELGLRIAIAGGREAGRVAEELARRDVPVLLDLDWGDEVADPDQPKGGKEKGDKEGGEEGAEGEAAPRSEEGTGAPDLEYIEPLGVRREKRRLWLERRDTALRLQESGVRLAFCTGAGKASDLLAHARALVEAGLARDAALAALSTTPAALTRSERFFGALRPGASATFCLWQGDPLAKDGEVRWSFVDGDPQEFEAAPKKDAAGAADDVALAGTWKVVFDAEDQHEMTLELEAPEGAELRGHARTTNPSDGSALAADVTGTIDGATLEISMKFHLGDLEIDLFLSGDVDGDHWSGVSRLTLPGSEQEIQFTADRLPEGGDLR